MFQAQSHSVSRLGSLSKLAAPSEVVRQFTPNWFAATMGTGILALALAQIPVQLPGQKAIARGLWMFDTGLFVLFASLYAARWMFYFDGARRIFRHGVMSMSLGCVPMGLATIINGLLLFGAPRWGHQAIVIAQALWGLDALMALACGLAVPFLMFTRQDHSLEQMTATWLLPIVASEVAAVSGGLLAPHLTAAPALAVLIASYGLWACSVPLALGVLVILFLRLALHKLPPAHMAATSWLALGPIGTGALGLLVTGAAAPAILAANGLGAYGEAARGIGLIGGVLMWGYGLWWLAMATMITLRHLRAGLPFNLGWWAYTFPLGVYAVATLRLSTLLPIPILAVFAQGLVAALAVLWLIVAALTARGVWRGELFVSPCLAQD